MYELIILSHLMRRAAHGYRISKIINDIIGPYAKLSNGSFYPLLTKLEQQGLIEVCSESPERQVGERQARQYAITDKGRAHFHRLMLHTSSNSSEYQRIFLFKMAAFDLIQPAERFFLLDHYINYTQAHILHLKAEAEELLEAGPGGAGMDEAELIAAVHATRHLGRQWELELELALQLREQESSKNSPNSAGGTDDH